MGAATQTGKFKLRMILRRTDWIITYCIHKILRGAMYIFYLFVKPYSMYKCSKIKQKSIPPITNELLKIPAIKLASMIRTQKITCEIVIKSYIKRCQEVNPIVNAIVQSCYDDALKRAQEIDNEIKSGLRSIEQMEIETPILGLPVTVKESIAVNGMSNQSGRVHKIKYIATDDSPIVKNVKRNGGIILLVSNTPELCLCWETYNNVTGITLNPHNLKRTPGGSSGGEAALLCCGASLLALGSDVAGSVRLPAMFVGVYGHKPSPGICSPYGHIPGSTDTNWGRFFTTGCMTRYAEDLPLLLKAAQEINGPIFPNIPKPVNNDKINFYYMTEDPSGCIQKLDRDIHNSLITVAKYFNAKEINLKRMRWSFDIALCEMLPMDFETIYTKSTSGEKPKHFPLEIIKSTFGLSDSAFPSVIMCVMQFIVKYLVPARRHRQLRTISNELRADFQKILGTNGVLLYPTFPTSAHYHYEIFYKMMDTTYMMVFNALGLPVTQVRTGVDRHNLPIGIQVIGNPGCDHLTMAVAERIQKQFGGWIEPCNNISKITTNEPISS